MAALCGCGPTVSRQHAVRLAAAGVTLLEHPQGEIPESSWPEAVTRLDPRRVYRAPEGVYIITHAFFVEERGVFILDPASSFVPSSSDPAYDGIGPGVFIYRSAG